MEGEALVSGELKTDRTNRNTLCSDVIMRCTLRMCSEYGPLATLTACTEHAIRKLLLTVRNSPTVLDMTERGRRWGRGEAGGRLLNKAFLVEASPRGPVPYPYIYQKYVNRRTSRRTSGERQVKPRYRLSNKPKEERSILCIPYSEDGGLLINGTLRFISKEEAIERLQELDSFLFIWCV